MRPPGITTSDGRLFCDELPLTDIAARCQTPFYVYSGPALEKRFRDLDEAFRAHKHLHCVAFKANSQPALLGPLAQAGAGAEVVSGVELKLARSLGFAPERIVFSGVGKSEKELEAGIRADIRLFLVESRGELERLERLAVDAPRPARVALRINPDIDPKTHPHIATGHSRAKFGIDPEQAADIYSRPEAYPHIDFAGIHAHIGSQITSQKPLAENARWLATAARNWIASGLDIRDVDVGGGLGIAYRDETALGFGDYAEAVLPAFTDLDVVLLTELGRALFGPIGALIVKVQYLKQVHGRSYAVVDAGMNDLLRPALYDAYHRVVPLASTGGEPRRMDVVGAVCESSDVFARDRDLAVRVGDPLAILDCGAYGYAMSSNYNLRPRPAEILVTGEDFRVVRRAETEDELLRRELGVGD